MFRGREMQHPELGRRILDQVADVVDHIANIEFGPNLEGRNMIMVLGPDKKKIAAVKKALEEAAAVEAAEVEAAAVEAAEVEAAAVEAAEVEAAEPAEVGADAANEVSASNEEE